MSLSNLMNVLPSLGTSTSTDMPSIATSIPWRSWANGVQEAAERAMPMLVVAEPGWTNGAQRLAAMLGKDDHLQEVCASLVVPVLVDPTEDDVPVDRWHLFAVAQAGTLGPPLVLLMSDEGLPLLAYTSLRFEGDDSTPSLTSVISAMANAWENDADAVRAECREVNEGIQSAESSTGSDGDWWGHVEPHADTAQGGLREDPRHSHPQLLRRMLASSNADGKRWVETTLQSMMRGGIRDQLGGGFFRCARDGRWMVPHFEKSVPQNAQLAAVYAEAARVCGRSDFRDVAVELARFCTVALRDGVDRVASESNYYTWTAREVRDAVKPDTLQVVALHFGITPGSHRYALHPVVPEAELDRFGHQSVDVMQAALVRGKAQLAAVRQRRPHPEAAKVAALSWRAETIRWLYCAEVHDLGVDSAALAGYLDAMTQSMGANGFARTDSVVTVADQTSMLAALLAAAEVDDHPRWLERATALAQLVCQRFVRDGQVFRSPDAFESEQACWSVVDGDVPATLPSLIAGLRHVGTANGMPDLNEIADTIAGRVSGLVGLAGIWGASAWSEIPAFQ